MYLRHFRRLWPLLGLACLVWLSGCERAETQLAGPETDDPYFRQGQQLARQGRAQEALAAYLKVIARRGDAAPESNLEVGLIYQQSIKDPIAAIYYFRKYLELQPNSRQAVYVRGLVDNAKREFARTLPGAPLESQTQRLDLMEQIDRLQRENDDLKAEIASARASSPGPVTRSRFSIGETTDENRAGTKTAPAANPSPPPIDLPVTLAPEEAEPAAPTRPTANTVNTGPVPPTRPGTTAAQGGRRHVVVKGDTLFSLAQRYYNNRSRWRDILAANRDVLANENTPLRIGMELRIP